MPWVHSNFHTHICLLSPDTCTVDFGYFGDLVLSRGIRRSLQKPVITSEKAFVFLFPAMGNLKLENTDVLLPRRFANNLLSYNSIGLSESLCFKKKKKKKIKKSVS